MRTEEVTFSTGCEGSLRGGRGGNEAEGEDSATGAKRDGQERFAKGIVAVSGVERLADEMRELLESLPSPHAGRLSAKIASADR